MVAEKIQVQNQRVLLSNTKEGVMSAPAYRSIPLPLLVLEKLAVIRPIVPNVKESSEKTTPIVSKEKIQSEIYKTNKEDNGTIGSFQRENELGMTTSVTAGEDSNGSTTAIVLKKKVKCMSVGCAVCSVTLEANEDVYKNLIKQKLTLENCPSDFKQDPLSQFEPQAQMCPLYGSMEGEKSASLNIVIKEPPIKPPQLKFPLVVRTSAITQGNESCLAVGVSPGYLAPKVPENIFSHVCQERISNISNEEAFVATDSGFSLQMEPLAINRTNIEANTYINSDKCFYEDVQENATQEETEEKQFDAASSSNISTKAESIVQSNTETSVTDTPQKSSADTGSSDVRRDEKASHEVSKVLSNLEAQDEDICDAGSSNVSRITNKGDYVNKTADPMVTFGNIKSPGRSTVSKQYGKSYKGRTITMKDDISNVIKPKQLKLVAEHTSFASNARNNKTENGKTVLSKSIVINFDILS